jgi:hypothetical protein
MRQPINKWVPTWGGVGRTHGSSRSSAKYVGYGNIYSKTPRTGVFRRQMIQWASAAMPCRSSGCDPSPACATSRLAPRGESSSTRLVGCHRAPCLGGASWLSAASTNAYFQLIAVRTLVATKRSLRYRSRPRKNCMQGVLSLEKRYIGLYEPEILALGYI